MEKEIRTVCNWNEAKEMLLNSARPIGIVVMCADSSVKNKFVYSTLERSIGMICIASVACSIKSVKNTLEGTSTVCISLTPKEAGSQARRREITTRLQKAGVKTIYGVYLQIKEARFPEVQSAMKTLNAKPPTAEEFDGLIALREEDLW